MPDARVEAERAIADVLGEHPFDGWEYDDDEDQFYAICGGDDCDRILMGRHESSHQAHRAHVASLLADLMAERQAEALNEVARWLGTVYQVNPMNHDGSNHTIDRVVQQLDRQAGTNAPSRAFEDAWDERMDKYEADYYGGDGKQRRARRALARLATDRPDPKDTRDEQHT